MRIEKDWLGEIQIENESLFGIHTKRAMGNFDLKYKKTNIELIKAYALVKKACAIANFKTEKINEEKKNAIVFACDEINVGKYEEAFPISALQGGAGTSINMNLNEVIANIGLKYLGKEYGEYQYLSPLEDVNLSQSTNDTYPTALKVAIIKLLRELVDDVMELQNTLQEKEKEFSDIIKIGRTQLKDAVPMTLGQSFGAFSEAVARDRWRLYKAEERIRQVNLGGTAIGTGVGASMKYRFTVNEELRRITGYGLAKAENLIDATQNIDLFVEVSGFLKTYAVNLSKISNDLRLMDSGPNSGIGEIELPPLQAGSSIMAGKINPVGAELIKQIYYKTTANDLIVTMAAADGEFELNAMMPSVAEAILESLEILRDGTRLFSSKVIKNIKANKEKCREHLEKSWSASTLVIDKIGYDGLSEVLKESFRTGKDYKDILREKGIEI